MNIKFEDLVGKTGILCAVEGFKFRIGDLTFEAIEDEIDGYRSSLLEVKLLDGNLRPTFREEVTIMNAGDECSKYGHIRGIKLVNNIEKVILVIGTDDCDGYYPCFVFEYNSENLTQTQQIVDELLNRVTE